MKGRSGAVTWPPLEGKLEDKVKIRRNRPRVVCTYGSEDAFTV